MRATARVYRTSKALADAHSNVVGGSSARLRRMCPKSIDEEAKVPKQPAGLAADTGSALHHVMERALRGNWGNTRVFKEFGGIEVKTEGMNVPVIVTHEMLENKVIPALEWLDATVHIDAEIFYEKKMQFPGIDGAFGTGDIVFDTSFMDQPDGEPGEVGVVDWKFGDGSIVEAEDNDQMRFYLASARYEGLLTRAPKYVAYIYQPAAKLQPDEYAKRAEYTAEDLDLFVADLQDAITLWREGRAAHNPGAHCANCRGKLVCKAYAAMLNEAVATDVQGLNTRDLAVWMDRFPALKNFMDEVYAAALRNAQDQREVPGYVLETALGNRTWKDSKAAWAALGRLGLSADERTKKDTISAPQALTQLKKLGTPAAQIERFEKLHVIRPENGERLVKAKAGQEAGTALDKLATALKAQGF